MLRDGADGLAEVAELLQEFSSAARCAAPQTALPRQPLQRRRTLSGPPLATPTPAAGADWGRRIRPQEGRQGVTLPLPLSPSPTGRPQLQVRRSRG